ncbi:MAG: Stage V sporulation protein involved in spore cortex synthesis (SpoVR) [Hydrogenibacillus schlegelii]|uniref:Stage V sporulation protein involved in spore cortex synthesis (SpoVR) n=1 Tax=Hydrogenibacillus schlegelii TaxID=1484 RepID=A0A2T5GDT6_HYDSH|nr:hypothetical protein [Hydrogenibacillus schlegelii]PTQ54361.1 MAG: Stage V sporulation protein involved in spore cortex synthesis (SpoVR) [Hydrogenibacillus schlegelii]
METLDLCAYNDYNKAGRRLAGKEDRRRGGGEALIRRRTNGGSPTIVVEDGDFERRGLLLRRVYDALELAVRYIEKRYRPFMPSGTVRCPWRR